MYKRLSSIGVRTLQRDGQEEAHVRDKEFSINADTLRTTPQLMDCPHWDQAEFLGCLNYHTERAIYDGALVKYEEKLYYVNKAQIESLRRLHRWNLKKAVTVHP